MHVCQYRVAVYVGKTPVQGVLRCNVNSAHIMVQHLGHLGYLSTHCGLSKSMHMEAFQAFKEDLPDAAQWVLNSSMAGDMGSRSDSPALPVHCTVEVLSAPSAVPEFRGLWLVPKPISSCSQANTVALTGKPIFSFWHVSDAMCKSQTDNLWSMRSVSTAPFLVACLRACASKTK